MVRSILLLAMLLAGWFSGSGIPQKPVSFGSIGSPASGISNADSVPTPATSTLIIKVFATDIGHPLTSAVVTITTQATGQSERFTLTNGWLKRTISVAGEVTIQVIADGFISVKRNLFIALPPKGSHYEFDAELETVAAQCIVWAVDSRSNQRIRTAQFAIRGATGMPLRQLVTDTTTGMATINLPKRGVYELTTQATGYDRFTKSITLDKEHNQVYVTLTQRLMPPSEPLSKPVLVDSQSVTYKRPSQAAFVTANHPSPSARLPASFERPEKGKPVQLHNIYFDQSSPTLRPASFAELDQLAQLLADHPLVQIEVRGYTDNQGDFDANTQLSRDRCQAVIDYLTSRGIQKKRLKAVGKGPLNPVAPNNSEENRKKNRRVEFVIL